MDEKVKNDNLIKIELFKAVISSGQAALKSAMLINGGASVATLTFIGNTFRDRTTLPQAQILSWSLTVFAAGVFFSAVASGLAYCSQVFFGNQGKTADILGKVIRAVCVVFVIISYISFCVGVFFAGEAFSMQSLIG